MKAIYFKFFEAFCLLAAFSAGVTAAHLYYEQKIADDELAREKATIASREEFQRKERELNAKIIEVETERQNQITKADAFAVSSSKLINSLREQNRVLNSALRKTPPSECQSFKPELIACRAKLLEGAGLLDQLTQQLLSTAANKDALAKIVIEERKADSVQKTTVKP